ncbi:hypothetical protein DV738_g4109, partial [Chaetothyriales sp. CBS 135597]
MELGNGTNAEQQQQPLHAYYPPGVAISNYVANTLSTTTILALFALTCSAMLVPSYLVIKRMRPSLPTSEVATALWFILCGCIHTGLEGHFSRHAHEMGSLTDLLTQAWKEYSLSDSRYLTQDSFVVCMETVTAFLWGPMSFLCAYCIMIISTGQLYGTVLYYATFTYDEMLFQQSYSRPEWYYFWGYYVFLNSFWIWIPALLIVQSGKEIKRVFARVEALEIATRPSLFSKSALSSTRSFSSFYPLRQQAAVRDAEQSKPEVEGAEASPEITRFSELAEQGIIDRRVIENLARMKIHTMTDVQRMTINECLDGSDVIGQAKTGTGKTLAFLIPIIQRMMLDPDVTSRWERPTAEDIRAVIISPTRELAEQIAVEAEKVTAGTRLVVQTAVGGTQKSFHLRKMQRQGCHLLIGTPGRITDLLADPQSGVKLDRISAFVLDEADRLLDIGFAPAIEEIQSYMPPREVRDRQTLMFSATVPRSVVNLVRATLKPDFKFVRTIDPDEAPVHERIPQKMVVLPGLQNQIPALVELATRAIEAHKQDPDNNMPFKAIVFANSQSEVALLKSVLQNMRDPGQGNKRGMFDPHPLSPCQIYELYGRLTQRERNANTEGFRKAKTAILCSSDVAARGMDFPNVSHVIQLGLPRGHDDYIHRIGRTGRAGKGGEGWMFLNKGDERTWEREFGRDIKLSPDNSLFTTSLDMTQGQQLPANIARVMQLVESGIRATRYELKADAYRSLLSALKQSSAKYRDQEIVDMVNMLARCEGLEISDSTPDQDRGDRRGGFRSGRQDSYDKRDPFGMGMGGGVGAGRNFGGNRGGYGRGDRGGFGREDRGGFGREDRGGFGREDRGGFGREDRGGFGREDRGGFGRGGRGGGFNRESSDG